MPEHSRRHLLRAAGCGTIGIIGLSGCVSQFGESSNTDDTDASATANMQIERVSVTSQPTSPELELSVTPVSRAIGDGAGPGTLQFGIQNTGSKTVTIRSGPAPPFGPLAVRASDRDAGALLWADTYDETEHIEQQGDGIMIADIQRNTELSAGEQRTQQYELRATEAEPGQYRVTTVGGSATSLRFGEVQYTVALDIVDTS